MKAPAFDTTLYVAALDFAAAAHAGQSMPGSDLPYLTHVVTVAAEVIASLSVEPRADADLAVACALLHDTVEDTDVTVEQVEARFGAAVAQGVLALSKDPNVPKADRMADSLKRIRQCPHAVWIVKLADRITNLAEPPYYWPDAKRIAYRTEAGRIGAALGDASPYLSGRLNDRMEAYRAFIGTSAS